MLSSVRTNGSGRCAQPELDNKFGIFVDAPWGFLQTSPRGDEVSYFSELMLCSSKYMNIYIYIYICTLAVQEPLK